MTGKITCDLFFLVKKNKNNREKSGLLLFESQVSIFEWLYTSFFQWFSSPKITIGQCVSQQSAVEKAAGQAQLSHWEVVYCHNANNLCVSD